MKEFSIQLIGTQYAAVDMTGNIGRICFTHRNRDNVEKWISLNGKIYEKPLCPLCFKPSETGTWVSNSNGKGQVCFNCRNK